MDAAIKSVKQSLKKEKGLSPAFRSSLELLLLLVKLLLDRVTLNSSTSSIPPSADPNRKKPERSRGNRKPGGQKGHEGKTIEPVENPDKIVSIEIDKRTIPTGVPYQVTGYEARQVIDIKISRLVTEYRAQILEDSDGNQYVADFPPEVVCRAQYGNTIKTQAVYMSQFQLIPYARVRDYFVDQMQIPLSAGTIFNFNQQAFNALEFFESWVKSQLTASALLHVDETGININGKRHWLNCASNLSFTHYYPHEQRGSDAMDEIGIIPQFTGVMCHDHWKPYYSYLFCLHQLCNAHHLRELERAWEQDEQHWAESMKLFLIELNDAVEKAMGKLAPKQAKLWHKRYQGILEQAQQECPPPKDTRPKGTRGRLKRSKSRNLLERLIRYEDDVLRFMTEPIIPFTNNQGENDIRMTKVQQKISGCFRSMEGAKMFCRIRSYLSTCRKNGLSATKALNMLFAGETPAFMSSDTELAAKAA